MIFNATDNPADGYNGFGQGAGSGGNIYSTGILFADYITNAIRTDFSSPQNIGEIRIFTGHGYDGESARSFVNCKLEYSTDQVSFVTIVVPNSENSSNVHTTVIGNIISTYGTGFSNVISRIYDTTSGILAGDVRSLRCTFYRVGWEGEFRPTSTAAEGTVVREIDVIQIPEPVVFCFIGLAGIFFLLRSE